MEKDKKACCHEAGDKKVQGVLPGVLYGLLPHSFCIIFAIFAIIGSATATAFLKNILLIPNLFTFLVSVSFVLATISAVIYLKKTDCLCLPKIKEKWRYLTTVYFLTLVVNLSMFYVVMPAFANINFRNTDQTALVAFPSLLKELSMDVDIPCSGHATLIMDEVKKNLPIASIKFTLPNTFAIKYDPAKVTPGEITSLEIFKTFKATVN